MDARTKHYLDKEKIIVDKILLYVSNNKITLDSNEYLEFISFLNELFTVEASMNDIRYNVAGIDNEVIFNVKRLYVDDSSGFCFHNMILGSDGRFIRDNAEIVINNNTRYFVELSDNNPMYRIEACKKIIKTIYHELNHLLVLKSFVTHLSSDKLLFEAKEFIFLEDSFGSRNIYKKNHDNFMIENEADIAASLRFEYMMDEHYDKNKKLLCLSRYFSCDLTIDKGDKKVVVSRNDFINNYIDFLIEKKKYKFLLMKYPILQKEYTFECKRKTLEELALKYLSELNNLASDNSISENKKDSLRKNIKSMYFSLFSRSFSRTEDNEFKRVFNILGAETFEEMISFNNINALNDEKILHQLYSSKETKTSKFNFLKRNFSKEYISYAGDECFLQNADDLKKAINFYSYGEETQEKIEKYFINRIPKCGYVLSIDGKLIDLITYFEKYFLPNINYINDLNSFIDIMSKYIQSENMLLLEVGRRRIQNSNNKKNNMIREIISTYSKEIYK